MAFGQGETHSSLRDHPVGGQKIGLPPQFDSLLKKLPGEGERADQMSNAQEYFIAESIAHARTLPLPDAVRFLRGLLESCGDENALAPIRNVYIALSQSDNQLELIQNGQLKFKLGNGCAK